MFQKGRQKTGGRKKGNPSKSSSVSLRSGLESTNFNLAKEFLNVYALTANAELKFKILKEIAKYTQPPAPKEYEGDEDDDDDEDSGDFLRQLKDSLNEADQEASKESMASGSSILEAPQSPAKDLQADPGSAKGPA